MAVAVKPTVWMGGGALLLPRGPNHAAFIGFVGGKYARIIRVP